jgi:hypothetical protein
MKDSRLVGGTRWVELLNARSSDTQGQCQGSTASAARTEGIAIVKNLAVVTIATGNVVHGVGGARDTADGTDQGTSNDASRNLSSANTETRAGCVVDTGRGGSAWRGVHGFRDANGWYNGCVAHVDGD